MLHRARDVSAYLASVRSCLKEREESFTKEKRKNNLWGSFFSFHVDSLRRSTHGVKPQDICPDSLSSVLQLWETTSSYLLRNNWKHFLLSCLCLRTGTMKYLVRMNYVAFQN
jgi:hypothetical protein